VKIPDPNGVAVIQMAKVSDGDVPNPVDTIDMGHMSHIPPHRSLVCALRGIGETRAIRIPQFPE
jgi:hypothetical protein